MAGGESGTNEASGPTSATGASRAGGRGGSCGAGSVTATATPSGDGDGGDQADRQPRPAPTPQRVRRGVDLVGVAAEVRRGLAVVAQRPGQQGGGVAGPGPLRVPAALLVEVHPERRGDRRLVQAHALRGEPHQVGGLALVEVLVEAQHHHGTGPARERPDQRPRGGVAVGVPAGRDRRLRVGPVAAPGAPVLLEQQGAGPVVGVERVQAAPRQPEPGQRGKRQVPPGHLVARQQRRQSVQGRLPRGQPGAEVGAHLGRAPRTSLHGLSLLAGCPYRGTAHHSPRRSSACSRSRR